jgi:hypothetical protein
MDFDIKINRFWKYSNVFIASAIFWAPSGPLQIEFHTKPTKA